MPSRDKIPAYPALFVATFEALRNLGGSAANEELRQQVITDLALPDDVLEAPHGDTGKPELDYRLAWARTYLRIAGYIANSGRGVWAFTSKGHAVTGVDGPEILRAVRGKTRQARRAKQRIRKAGSGSGDGPPTTTDWREQLLVILLGLAPTAFERLCQRVLRESGFVQVEVTGRSGDGGIDGHGIVRIASLLSFPVLFQCKRWKGSVPPAVVRDFRGAMIGRADKGLIITTGAFSVDARREATRDGAPPIDLVDGEQLIDKLRELTLGVRTRQVEVTEVDDGWFATI